MPRAGRDVPEAPQRDVSDAPDHRGFTEQKMPALLTRRVRPEYLRLLPLLQREKKGPVAARNGEMRGSGCRMLPFLSR
jgi:hypothetical protein